jgi:uncharacterized protein GlcG (DUF336 family)
MSRLTRIARMCAVVAAALPFVAHADNCAQLNKAGVNYAALKSALTGVVPKPGVPLDTSLPNGGLGFPMWLTLVDGSGVVCAVVNSLDGVGAHNKDNTADIWLGSRVISAQKANTANAFSNGLLALSTANLYSAVQPGGSLFGLQHSNPVEPLEAYEGAAANFGTAEDPMVGRRIGGVNVFGGGLALYSGGRKVGAIGVSGDTSCTDHVVAWKVRGALKLGSVPPFGAFDKMIQDIANGASPSGFGHPTCLNNPTAANDGGAIQRP